MTVSKNFVLIPFVLSISVATMAWADTGRSGRVPFVGCASDGQIGPQPAPTNGRTPAVPPSLAGRLAYYSSGSLGVLAPRGWHCFGLYGSNGSLLIVTPERHDAADLLTPSSTLAGAAIQLSLSSGETSRRFEVAEVAARLFPAKKEFVARVIGEGIEPASAFPEGPYPGDILHRRSDTEVEFETPAESEGMGTRSRLVKNGDPIRGLAIVTNENDLVLLDVRVERGLRRLAPTIIEATAAAWRTRR